MPEPTEHDNFECAACEFHLSEAVRKRARGLGERPGPQPLSSGGSRPDGSLWFPGVLGPFLCLPPSRVFHGYFRCSSFRLCIGVLVVKTLGPLTPASRRRPCLGARGGVGGSNRCPVSTAARPLSWSVPQAALTLPDTASVTLQAGLPHPFNLSHHT